MVLFLGTVLLVREVARTIQGRKAPEAVEYLALIPRKSARLLARR